MKKIEHSEEIPEIGFVTWATEKKNPWLGPRGVVIPVMSAMNPQTDSVRTAVFLAGARGSTIVKVTGTPADGEEGILRNSIAKTAVVCTRFALGPSRHR